MKADITKGWLETLEPYNPTAEEQRNFDLLVSITSTALDWIQYVNERVRDKSVAPYWENARYVLLQIIKGNSPETLLQKKGS